MSDQCPDCRARLVTDVVPGNWCARCGHGLPLAPFQPGRLELLNFRFALAKALVIFRRARRDPLAEFPTRIGVGSLVLSGFYLAVWLSLPVLAVVFAMEVSDPVAGYSLAGLALAAFFILRPGRLYSRVRARAVSREESPALYALAARVANAVGVPAPVVIRTTRVWNCSAHREGPLRRPTLTLGLPGVLTMTGPERVALLAYELTQLERGIPWRNTALRPLLIPSSLMDFVNPRSYRSEVARGLIGLLAPVRIVAHLLAMATLSTGTRGCHHLHYRACRTTARVAGRSAAIALSGKLLLFTDLTELTASLDTEGEVDPSAVRAAAEALAEKGRERTAELHLESLTYNSLVNPASALLDEFTRLLPDTPPLVTVDDAENAAIDAELARLWRSSV